MSTGGQYVAAAYGVVLFALMVYVVVVGLRSARLAREAELLARLVEPQDGHGTAGAAPERAADAGAAAPRTPTAPEAAPHR